MLVLQNKMMILSLEMSTSNYTDSEQILIIFIIELRPLVR